MTMKQPVSVLHCSKVGFIECDIFDMFMNIPLAMTEGEGEAEKEGFSNFSPPLLPKHSSEGDKVTMDTETKKETVVAVAVDTTPIAEDDSPEKRSFITQAKIDVVVDKVGTGRCCCGQGRYGQALLWTR